MHFCEGCEVMVRGNVTFWELLCRVLLQTQFLLVTNVMTKSMG
jgi:hypothetical protein